MALCGLNLLCCGDFPGDICADGDISGDIFGDICPDGDFPGDIFGDIFGDICPLGGSKTGFLALIMAIW